MRPNETRTGANMFARSLFCRNNTVKCCSWHTRPLSFLYNNNLQAARPHARAFAKVHVRRLIVLTDHNLESDTDICNSIFVPFTHTSDLHNKKPTTFPPTSLYNPILPLVLRSNTNLFLTHHESHPRAPKAIVPLNTTATTRARRTAA